MAVCTYDNPSTMARECWQDGLLFCHYKAVEVIAWVGKYQESN